VGFRHFWLKTPVNAGVSILSSAFQLSSRRSQQGEMKLATQLNNTDEKSDFILAKRRITFFILIINTVDSWQDRCV